MWKTCVHHQCCWLQMRMRWPLPVDGLRQAAMPATSLDVALSPYADRPSTELERCFCDAIICTAAVMLVNQQHSCKVHMLYMLLRGRVRRRITWHNDSMSRCSSCLGAPVWVVPACHSSTSNRHFQTDISDVDLIAVSLMEPAVS